MHISSLMAASRHDWAIKACRAEQCPWAEHCARMLSCRSDVCWDMGVFLHAGAYCVVSLFTHLQALLLAHSVSLSSRNCASAFLQGVHHLWRQSLEQHQGSNKAFFVCCLAFWACSLCLKLVPAGGKCNDISQ